MRVNDHPSSARRRQSLKCIISRERCAAECGLGPRHRAFASSSQPDGILRYELRLRFQFAEHLRLTSGSRMDPALSCFCWLWKDVAEKRSCLPLGVIFLPLGGLEHRTASLRIWKPHARTSRHPFCSMVYPCRSVCDDIWISRSGLPHVVSSISTGIPHRINRATICAYLQFLILVRDVARSAHTKCDVLHQHFSGRSDYMIQVLGQLKEGHHRFLESDIVCSPVVAREVVKAYLHHSKKFTAGHLEETSPPMDPSNKAHCPHFQRSDCLGSRPMIQA